MDARCIKETEEFKRAMEVIVNQYASEVPATVMSLLFSNLAKQFETVAEHQYEKALKVLKESEVKQNVRDTDLQKDN